jgi:Lrp/AsnC family leucine-responsive transcriptional regulator
VAFVSVKLKKLDAETKVGEFLSRLPEVQEVHYVAGEDAFLVKIRAADTDALSGLIRDKIASISGVQSTQTAIALSTYKETARIPIDRIDE